MVKVMLPYELGEDCPGGGRLMTQSAGTVTAQSIAFKYVIVIAAEPYKSSITDV
jgi:hypothetical protein